MPGMDRCPRCVSRVVAEDAQSNGKPGGKKPDSRHIQA